ncbi:MAG: hypothetical protein WBG71_06460 [Leeuwenhoekiella sp.]
MDTSEFIESKSKGNWIEENILTKSSDNNSNIKIYTSVIDDYSRRLSRYNQETSGKLGLDHMQSQTEEDENDLTHLNETPELDFPNVIGNSYDIFNVKTYYKKVQNWRGVVLGIFEESFEARLEDLTNFGTDEIVELDLEEISPADYDLLEIGALFYWSVGRFMENGQIVNRSDIRFQRLITLDESDIEKTKTNIESKYSNLKERRIEASST